MADPGRRLWLHAAVVAPALAVATGVVLMAVYLSRPGGWMNPLVAGPGVGVGAAYAAAVATRAGARGAAATGWAAAAAVVSAIVVVITWFVAFVVGISISCGDESGNCL